MSAIKRTEEAIKDININLNNDNETEENINNRKYFLFDYNASFHSIKSLKEYVKYEDEFDFLISNLIEYFNKSLTKISINYDNKDTSTIFKTSDISSEASYNKLFLSEFLNEFYYNKINRLENYHDNDNNENKRDNNVYELSKLILYNLQYC